MPTEKLRQQSCERIKRQTVWDESPASSDENIKLRDYFFRVTGKLFEVGHPPDEQNIKLGTYIYFT